MTELLGRQWGEYNAEAKDPKPGTVVYRSEVRPAHEDLHSVGDTGRHWTTLPMDWGYGGPGYDQSQGPGRRVVWHGVVDDPVTQVLPAAKFKDRNEAEVRFHPGATVRVTGHSITTDRRGHVQVGPQPEVKSERNFQVKIRGGMGGP